MPCIVFEPSDWPPESQGWSFCDAARDFTCTDHSMSHLIRRVENPVQSRDRIEDFNDGQRTKELPAVLFTEPAERIPELAHHRLRHVGAVGKNSFAGAIAGIWQAGNRGRGARRPRVTLIVVGPSTRDERSIRNLGGCKCSGEQDQD